MNIRTGPYPEGMERAGEVDVCHYFLQFGKIKYLGDCTHVLKEQSIDLPDLPFRRDGRYVWLGSTLVDGVPP
jgi:hypothetical protein